MSSAGLGLLQYCNLNSYGTKFILGFSLFMGLSVPQCFNDYVVTTGNGPVHSRSTWFNELMLVIFTSSPTVATIVGMFFTGRSDTTTKMSEQMVGDIGGGSLST
ncbi:hypothetical protein Hdeb2414_s0006g00221131 [Helianthus debilis subsp. tardiflorus]